MITAPEEETVGVSRVGLEAAERSSDDGEIQPAQSKPGRTRTRDSLNSFLGGPGSTGLYLGWILEQIILDCPLYKTIRTSRFGPKQHLVIHTS